VDRDPELGKALAGGNDIGTRNFASNSKRDDRRVLEKEQQIRDAIRPALLDQLALERKGLLVCHQAQPSDFEQDPWGHFAYRRTGEMPHGIFTRHRSPRAAF
jgi:hypothetical protein